MRVSFDEPLYTAEATGVSSSENKHNVDPNILVGDSRAAYIVLGWRHTVDFDSMAGIMVRHDMALLKDPQALWPIP